MVDFKCHWTQLSAVFKYILQSQLSFLPGVSDDREGLFDTIQRSKAHSQKRGYQCIKAIVQLLSKYVIFISHFLSQLSTDVIVLVIKISV